MRPLPPDASPARHEAARLASLAGYHVLETPPEAALTRIARLAVHTFDVAVSAVSFVDGQREWIKAGCGLPHDLGAEATLGTPAVATGQTQVVLDTLDAAAWRHHPLVTGAPYLRFCASAPLLTPDGHAIGALCIADPRPRSALGLQAHRRLEDLAMMVMEELERGRLAGAVADLASVHRAALDLVETLGAVTALADSGLGPQEVALRITALTAAHLDTDWAGLLAVDGDRATVRGATYLPVAAGFARQVQDAVGLNAAGQDVAAQGGLPWPGAALEGVHFGAGAAALGFVPGGVTAAATAPLGTVDGVRYVMAFVRLHRDAAWSRREQHVIRAVVQAASGLFQNMASRVALATLQDRLRLTVESGPLILWATDMRGRFTLSEGQGLRVLGSEPGAAVGHATADIYARNPAIIRNVGRALEGESFTTDVEALGRIFEAHYSPLHNEAGQQSGTVGVAYDITDRVMAERAARQAQARAEALVALSLVLDASAPFGDAARQALQALEVALGHGWTVLWERRGDSYVPLAQSGGCPQAGSESGQAPALGVSPDWLGFLGVADGHAAFLDGESVPLPARQAGIRGAAYLLVGPGLRGAGSHPAPGPPTLVLAASFATGSKVAWTPDDRSLLRAAARMLTAGAEQHQRVTTLEHAAATDALTGLGNRRAFEAEYASRLQAARLRQLCVEVVSIDVDGLKAINDQQGHARGDLLLRTFAASLQATFRAEDRAYRLGGDEFVVLLTDAQPLGAAAIHARLRDAVGHTRRADFPEMDASVGVALFPAEGEEPAHLLALSDQRMYSVKTRKRRAGR